MDKAEMMDQFTKLCESFEKKAFVLWVELWPAFKKNFQDFVNLHENIPLPDTPLDVFDGFHAGVYEHLDIDNPEGPPPVSDSAAAPGYEHLEINPEGPQLNLDGLDIPEGLIEAFAGASLPPLPPPVNKAPPPPAPLNDSAPTPAPDGISQRLSEAHRLAEEASVMVNSLFLDGSIKLNKNSVAHLEGCESNIKAAKEALQLAATLLSDARSVSQDESLSELLNDL